MASSLYHHHLDKLLIVDLAISIDICLSDHFVNLLVSEFLAEVCHHVAQLCGTDESIAIPVEDLERLNELLFCVCVFHLAGHQGKELWEINGSVAIRIDSL